MLKSKSKPGCLQVSERKYVQIVLDNELVYQKGFIGQGMIR